MSKNQISLMKKVSFCLLIFILYNNVIIGQNLEEDKLSEISILKEQFYSTRKGITRAKIATEISTTYRSIEEIDSTAKYASLAIDLLQKTKETLSTYKMLKAKAIENYGSALTYTDPKKAIDTLQVSLELWIETGNKSGIANGYKSIANAYGFSNNNIESVENYNKSLALYKELKNKAKEAEILYYISIEKRYSGNFGDALEYSLKSLKVAEDIRDTLQITNALLGNSFNYLLTENYAQALEEQKKALRLFQLSNDSIGIATTYNDMGVTNMRANNLKEALKYHKMALDIRKKVDLVSIGFSYNYIAEIYRKQGKLREALKSIKEGLPYSIKYSKNRFIIDDYFQAGEIYLELKDYDQAITNYNLALEIAKNNNDNLNQAKALLRLGQVHKRAGDIDTALDYLKQSDKVVAPQDFISREFIYKEMMEIYVDKNDYKNAFHFQTKFQQMSDSVSAATKAEKIATLTQELVYENKRAMQKASQDKQIALKESQIKTQKIIRNLSIAGLLLILVFAVIFYIRFKEKRRLSLSLEKTLSDLKGTQQQLIQSEKMASLGELTAGIAHEIQNPLNFVNNFSELNKELVLEANEEFENKDYEEVKAILKDIETNSEKINHHGKRADSIVKSMLQHSRASGNKKELTDINALADEYMRLAYHGLRAKDKSFNANLESNFDQTIEKIKVIPQDIGRVILNLFTNAFYAVNEKNSALAGAESNTYTPKVSVTTKKTGNYIQISVRDNGDGIPKESLNKIFQPFFTTKPTGKGTGLGLSMSYDIIKTHGGSLEVETKKGQYTKFTIKLPIYN